MGEHLRATTIAGFQRKDSRRFSVQDLNGLPTIYRYGKPIVPMAHYAQTMSPKAVKDLTAAGISFFTFPLNNTDEKGEYAPGCWCYDLQTGTFEEIAAYALKINPNALFMPRILVREPRDTDA